MDRAIGGGCVSTLSSIKGEDLDLLFSQELDTDILKVSSGRTHLLTILCFKMLTASC